jgi:hypothetical protein
LFEENIDYAFVADRAYSNSESVLERLLLMVGEEFPFKVVRINGSDEVLARSVNLLIGRAAFETAKRLYPKDVLEYRRGGSLLRSHGSQGLRHCLSRVDAQAVDGYWEAK